MSFIYNIFPLCKLFQLAYKWPYFVTKYTCLHTGAIATNKILKVKLLRNKLKGQNSKDRMINFFLFFYFFGLNYEDRVLKFCRLSLITIEREHDTKYLVVMGHDPKFSNIIIATMFYSQFRSKDDLLKKYSKFMKLFVVDTIYMIPLYPSLIVYF